VTFGNSTYSCGNYSREETIQGRKLYEEIRYAIFFTNPSQNTGHTKEVFHWSRDGLQADHMTNQKPP